MQDASLAGVLSSISLKKKEFFTNRIVVEKMILQVVSMDNGWLKWPKITKLDILRREGFQANLSKYRLLMRLWVKEESILIVRKVKQNFNQFILGC